MARPELNPEDRKDKIVCIRFKPAEWELVEADCRRRSFTPSAHIRRIMLLVAKGQVIVR